VRQNRESEDNTGGLRVKTEIKELESALEHTFSDPGLLIRALTHRSLAHQLAQKNGGNEAPNVGDNERLEFLGDAVLGLVVAAELFVAHPEWHEGELTRVRSGLVSRLHMAQVAEAVGLGKYLRLSSGEEHSGLRRKSTVLSNTMEAVMGALFLDGGLEPVRGFVQNLVMGKAADELASELRTGAAMGNYKSALQERLQAAHAGTPLYRLKSESGPDHHKRFLVEVRLKTDSERKGEPLARGMGRTKKHAEQDAARCALERMDAEAAGDSALESGLDSGLDSSLEAEKERPAAQ